MLPRRESAFSLRPCLLLLIVSIVFISILRITENQCELQGRIGACAPCLPHEKAARGNSLESSAEDDSHTLAPSCRTHYAERHASEGDELNSTLELTDDDFVTVRVGNTNIDVGNMHMYVHHAKTSVWVDGLIRKSAFEPNKAVMVATALGNVSALPASESRLFVDIGANVGFYSMLALALGHRVLSFEAMRYNYEVLVRSARRNRAIDRFSAWHVALGERDSDDAFCVEPTGQGGVTKVWQTNLSNGQVRRHNASTDDDSLCFEFLPLVRFDTIASECLRDAKEGIFMMKMDCEGCEPQALHGLERTLADPRLRPCFVLVEFIRAYVEREEATIDDLFAWMRERDYEVSALGAYGSPLKYHGLERPGFYTPVQYNTLRDVLHTFIGFRYSHAQLQIETIYGDFTTEDGAEHQIPSSNDYLVCFLARVLAKTGGGCRVYPCADKWCYKTKGASGGLQVCFYSCLKRVDDGTGLPELHFTHSAHGVDNEADWVNLPTSVNNALVCGISEIKRDDRTRCRVRWDSSLNRYKAMGGSNEQCTIRCLYDANGHVSFEERSKEILISAPMDASEQVLSNPHDTCVIWEILLEADDHQCRVWPSSGDNRLFYKRFEATAAPPPLPRCSYRCGNFVSPWLPTVAPSNSPTTTPTRAPSRTPSAQPTHVPSVSPTRRPTLAPQVGVPTQQPTIAPTASNLLVSSAVMTETSASAGGGVGTDAHSSTLAEAPGNVQGTKTLPLIPIVAGGGATLVCLIILAFVVCIFIGRRRRRRACVYGKQRTSGRRSARTSRRRNTDPQAVRRSSRQSSHVSQNIVQESMLTGAAGSIPMANLSSLSEAGGIYANAPARAPQIDVYTPAPTVNQGGTMPSTSTYYGKPTALSDVDGGSVYAPAPLKSALSDSHEQYVNVPIATPKMVADPDAYVVLPPAREPEFDSV